MSNCKKDKKNLKILKKKKKAFSLLKIKGFPKGY